jgi:hypothetical protein
MGYQQSWRTALRPLIALLGLMALAIAAPASAYSYGDGYTYASKHLGGHDGGCMMARNGGGEMYFCRDGDIFHLWDLNSDGKSVGARWTTSNGHSGLCRWAGGAGSAGDCNYDFPENVTVTFWAGLCNITSTVNCQSWSQYTNKTGSSSISAG